jgi:hypothetical protein
VFRINYRLPDDLPSHQRDFPPRYTTAPAGHHARDSAFLGLLVAGYLLALLGGIVLLRMLTPVSAITNAATGEISTQGRTTLKYRGGH